ncbi:disease resistance protein RUN1 [Jatropha curcas]|uniref:disease resistance protein RUN1 n=1 Tax=Jatropha curcas TaxID=180498 RepID=UPI001896311F|nr:disease resistance protein RUN1 [Jatropha curcas]
MESKEIVRNVFEACGFFPDITFAVLKDKALIRFSLDNKLLMHDLLQEMGREIVRQESKEPGKRSRLWIPEEIHQVLTKNKYLVHLKELDLRGCKYLTTIPNLSNAKNIETIDLEGCERLTELPSSIQYLDKLENLNLRHCAMLMSLPDKLDSNYLKEFHLTRCSNVKKCPEISSNIALLDLRYTAITDLPPFQNSTVQNELDLTGCSNLCKFPDISGNIKHLCLTDSAIEEVPSSIQFLTGLVRLIIKNNRKLLKLPDSICMLKSLKVLDLSGCTNFECFPEILEPMDSLSNLFLRQTSIKELPSPIEHLGRLTRLILDSCKKIASLSSTMHQLSRLNMIDLSCCDSLRVLPQFPQSLKNLKANHCKSLETLSSKSECNFQNMHLANCLELEGKVDAQFAIQIMAAKVCENGDEARFLFPGSEIPQWCRYKSIGSSGIIKLPSNWDKLKGVILCIVFALDQEPPRSLESPNEYWIRCKCYAKANSYEHEDLEEIIIWDRQCFDGDLHLVKSDHVFVWFNPFGTLFEGSSFVDLLKKYSGSEARFEFCIEGYSELARHCNWRVKKCGVDLLFDDEAITKETFASEEKEEIEPKPKRSKH